MAETSDFYKGRGGSLLKLHSVTLIGLASLNLHAALARRGYDRRGLVSGFAVLVVPLVLATTVMSDYLLHLNLLLLVASFALPLVGNNAHLPSKSSSSPATSMNRPFLTAYRAQMLLITIVSILAVDFSAFPREFVKCETYGTSLMDVGVGSFVFSLGLVAPSASGRATPAETSLRPALKRSVGLLTLGALRVAAVKGLEYPEQVQEYGVHWNFFWTLGLLPTLAALWSKLIPRRHRGKAPQFWLAGIAAAAAHQVFLSTFAADWVERTPRLSLVTANKEGIVSFPGYAAIFFLSLACSGRALGSFSETSAGYSPQGHLRSLAFASGAAWLLFAVSRQVLGIEVSRQLANLSYICWISAFNLSYLLGCLAIQHCWALEDPPPLLAAINRNGLFVFLVANVLTGAVNMSIFTQATGDGTAVAILLMYTSVVSIIAWLGRSYRLRF